MIKPSTLRVLSPQLVRLLEPLQRAAGRPVPVERLVSALYDHRHDGGPEDAAAAVHRQIWHLRQRLAAEGIAIETVGRGPGSWGYRVHGRVAEAGNLGEVFERYSA